MIFANIDTITRSLGIDACGFAPVPFAPQKHEDGFMAIAKGRQLILRKLNEVILKMVNTGLLQGLQRRWLYYKDVVCDVPTGFTEVSIGDVLPILLLLLLTSSFSLIVLVIECLRSDRRGSKTYLAKVCRHYLKIRCTYKAPDTDVD